MAVFDHVFKGREGLISLLSLRLFISRNQGGLDFLTKEAHYYFLKVKERTHFIYLSESNEQGMTGTRCSMTQSLGSIFLSDVFFSSSFFSQIQAGPGQQRGGARGGG